MRKDFERRTEYGIIVLILISLIYIGDNVSSTGMAVLGKENNIVIGSFLGILLFFFLVLYLYFRVSEIKRRKNY